MIASLYPPDPPRPHATFAKCLGYVLYQKRIGRNISILKLSEEIRLLQSTISSMESGKKGDKTSLNVLHNWARFVGYPSLAHAISDAEKLLADGGPRTQTRQRVRGGRMAGVVA